MESLRQSLDSILNACDTLLKSALSDQQQGDVLAIRTATQEISSRIDAAAAKLPALPTNIIAEVRSPLTILIGYAEVLLDRTATHKDQKQQLTMILREARPLLSVIENVFGLDQDRTDPLA